MIKHIINGETYYQYFIIFRKFALKSLIIYCEFMDCGLKKFGGICFFLKDSPKMENNAKVFETIKLNKN